jgi:hypothetical protein
MPINGIKIECKIDSGINLPWELEQDSILEINRLLYILLDAED